jgi:SAM-dependent methyltransferase
MDDWWASFFEGSWVDSQRTFFSAEANTRQSRFIGEVLGLRPGETLLDVPCGAGRIAIELARRGIRVTGVDASSSVIDPARSLAESEGLEIEFHHRDMRDLPWESAFDAAVCFWGSFGYLGDDGDRDYVTAVARALRPGGRFLIDTHVAESLLPVFQERGWTRIGEYLVAEERRFDHETSTCFTTWTYVRDGEIDVKQSAIRLYTYRELALLLKDAGFAITSAYSGYEMRPFKLGAGRLVVAAEKVS